jgi:hypothetical protein
MVAFKKPIPAEWHPDAAKTYEERYPMRLPNEVAGGGCAAPPGASLEGAAAESGAAPSSSSSAGPGAADREGRR